MMELPEAAAMAAQITATLSGKRIAHAVANASPHKFAWYSGDPAEYNDRLAGKTIRSAAPRAGLVEVHADDMVLALSTSLRYLDKDEKPPKKHQLLLSFEDATALVATVQMWGCLACFREGENAGVPDYLEAIKQPSPLSAAFDRAYFSTLFGPDTGTLSAKAFLATEQRIPGLGNGVAQDILWTSHIHPKRKMATLSGAEIESLFGAVKSVLADMVAQGGRDTERDLFGQPGGYITVLSRNTVDKPCPVCGTAIRKEAYLGGSIYYCGGCQPL
ncbi:MAG: endonuclease VIII [Anaerolineae bacterium]|nr:endonuclease VIII [Anaerolineae bacterium]